MVRAAGIRLFKLLNGVDGLWVEGALAAGVFVIELSGVFRTFWCNTFGGFLESFPTYDGKEMVKLFDFVAFNIVTIASLFFVFVTTSVMSLQTAAVLPLDE